MPLRLNLNENGLLKRKKLADNVSSELKYAHSYSGKRCEKTASLISRYYDIPQDNIVIYNGLSEAIFYTVLYCTLNLKGSIVTTEKTYRTVVDSAYALGNAIVEFPLAENQINLDTLCNNIEEYLQKGNSVSLCYICNPHNPTGSLYKGSLDRLLNLANRYDFLIFIDEAYIEFIEEERNNLREKISNENLIIGRTFSKAYGLAGLRCGYAITQNKKYLEWTDKINNALLLKENRLNVAAVDTVLFKENLLTETKARVDANREAVESILIEYGIKFFKSYTNFILAQPPCPVEDFINFSQKNCNMLLCDAASLDWQGFVRITVSENEAPTQIEKMLSQMKKAGLIK